MSDVTLACTILLAVLLAGALRAFTDRNIAIFYLSLFAVAVMCTPLALEHFGVVIPDAVLVLLGMLLLVSGTLLETCNRAHPVNMSKKSGVNREAA